MKRIALKVSMLCLVLAISLAVFAGCGPNSGEGGTKDGAAETNTQSAETQGSVEKTGEGSEAAGGQDKPATNEIEPEQLGESKSPDTQAKPAPAATEDTKVNKKVEYHATLLISCKTILDNLESFDQSKLEVLPENGIVYYAKDVEFYEGETVYDVLLRETRSGRIHMESVSSPVYGSAYIEGINNIYEFDCGELSGWMYRVNGWFPSYGCSRYVLKDGDQIEWLYTCDLGRDIGGDWKQQRSDN